MIKNIVFDVGNVIWKGNSKSIINYIKIDNLEDKENISTFFEGFRLMDLNEETIEEHYEKWKEKNNFNNDYDEKYKNQLINYYKNRLVKPDEEFFKVLFNKYNLNPEECFFVDDKEKNINAGKRLGMNGHVLDYENNKADELIKDLSANGVEI